MRGRLTIQEGRGKAAAYRGITHATMSVVREVTPPACERWQRNDATLQSCFFCRQHRHNVAEVWAILAIRVFRASGPIFVSH